MGLAGHAVALAGWWLQGPGPEPVAWRAATVPPPAAVPSPDGRRQAQVLVHEAVRPRSPPSGVSAGRMLAVTVIELHDRRSETWMISDAETGAPSLVWLDGQRLTVLGAGRPRVILTFARGPAL